MALLNNKKQPVKDLNGFMNKYTAVVRKNKLIFGIVAFLVVIIGVVMIFGTPSAEIVFKDMNEEMLKTKFVTVDQKLALKGRDSNDAEMNSNIFLNLSSSKELVARGTFSMKIKSTTTPMNIVGDLMKAGGNTYVRFNELSSTDVTISEAFVPIQSKLKNNWVIERDGDQFTSFAKSPLDSTISILPTPFANLNDANRKTVLDILRDKSMYNIKESSKVDISGTSTYKYLLEYDKSQFKKVEKALAGYVDYYKVGEDTGSEITSLTVWIDINTRRIIKIEYTGTSSQGDATGIISFSKYGQQEVVEKPSTYSIESELLN